MNIKDIFNIPQVRSNLIDYKSSKSVFLNDYKDALGSSNPKSIIEKLNEVLSLGVFQVDHPSNGVASKAVASFNCQTGNSKNYILMKSNLGQFWMIVQYTSFINAIVYDNKLEYLQNGGLVPSILDGLELALHFFNGLSCENSVFKGFYLEHQRPYHFFYEQIKGMQYISNSANSNLLARYDVYVRNSFIAQKQLPYLIHSININDVNNTVHNQGFTLKPLVFEQYNFTALSSAWSKQAMKEMEQELRETYTKESRGREDYDLVLWIGVTGQKRRWIDQENSYSNVIKQLATQFSKILVIVDGWTAKPSTIKHDETNIVLDQQVYCQIAEKCSSIATFKSIIGHSYESKINACKDVDFFIANAGSGCMVPLRFCNKDGVLHSNLSVFTFPDNYADYDQIVRTIDKDYIGVPEEERSNSADHTSYQISWKLVFNQLAEIINERRAINIPLLDIKLEDLYYLNEKEDSIPIITTQ